MGKKILLVDDERDFTELTKTLLGFHDFEVEALNDSKEVTGALAREKYDLVVCDLMMPGVDGFELVKQLRNDTKYSQTPILVLSAKTLTDEERKSLLKQGVHFVGKPFSPQGLVERITQLLGG